MPPRGQKLPLPGGHYYKETGCFFCSSAYIPPSLLCRAGDEWEERGSEWTLFSNASRCWISNNSPNKTQTSRPLCFSISSLFGLSHQAWQHLCSSVARHMLGGQDGLLFRSFFPSGGLKQQSPLPCLLCWGRSEDRLEEGGEWCNPPLAGLLVSSKVTVGIFKRVAATTHPSPLTPLF